MRDRLRPSLLRTGHPASRRDADGSTVVKTFDAIPSSLRLVG